MLKITFLGTRGEIKPKTKRHAMHTSLLLTFGRKRVMIDCGTTWLGKIDKVHPDHIVLTHAHPDHAFGLKEGAPCPVWATKETWALIDKFPIPKTQRHVLTPRKKRRIGEIQFEAFPLLHSLRCPAVGYRITRGKNRFFYAPDVAWIENMEEALRGNPIYIGDGATVTREMIRKVKGTEDIFGHASVRRQLTWCQKMGVTQMIVTHLGSEIVSNEKRAWEKIQTLAEERDVECQLAYDGLQLTFEG